MLKRGSIVDATIIAAPSSTKNAEGERDPADAPDQKGNQWHFGMKAHIGVDTDNGLVHGHHHAGDESDVGQIAHLLHAREQQVWADSGYRGRPSAARRPGMAHCRAPSDIAMLPDGRREAAIQKQEHH